MADATTQLIKEKLDIVEFLKGYLTLIPAGRTFKALCPFHGEKTPSFSVSPDRGSWHCFGCGEGGDVFSFLMKYEHIEFAEALKILAEKTGVPLARMDPAQYRAAGMLYDINAAAVSFFKSQLAGTSFAKEYLRGRGLTDETIEAFDIGWAPNEPDTLAVHLIKTMGARPDDIVQAGLAFISDRGMVLDRFRGRLMFPIANHLGKVVGFTGRVYPPFDTGTSGKYVNSPETAVFNKSRVLYGFYKTKEDVAKQNMAVVVEGQMDFLMSYQAGVRTVVASSGTAFTSEHLGALRKVCDKLTFLFDNDEAGIAAGDRAVDLAYTHDFEVSVARLPHDVKDPADAAQKDPDMLRRSVADAAAALAVFIDRHFPPGTKGFDFTKAHDVAKLRQCLAKIAQVKSPVAASGWLQFFSRRVGVSTELLTAEMNALVLSGDATVSSNSSRSSQISDPSAGAPSVTTMNRHQRLSFELLCAAYQLQDFSFLEEYASYLAPGFGQLVPLLVAGTYAHPQRDIDAALSAIALSTTSYTASDVFGIAQKLKHESTRSVRQKLIDSIAQAERVGDTAALSAALAELAQLPSGGIDDSKGVVG